MIILTEENFDKEVLESKKPVIVDFWAEWCHPCKVMEPIIDKIAKEVNDVATIAKVNVDENPGLAERFDIVNIPNFTVFEKGVAVKSAVGSMDKKRFIETFHKWLT